MLIWLTGREGIAHAISGRNLKLFNSNELRMLPMSNNCGILVISRNVVRMCAVTVLFHGSGLETR